MKFFKNKFLGIATLVVIFLVIFYSVIAAMGQTLMLSNVLGAVATPFRYGFRAIGNALGGFSDYVTEFHSLKEENDRLSERVRELERENAGAQVLENENEWLRGFLGMREELTEFELIDAHVTGRESTSYMTLYTLNRGSLHGVEVDMTVITPEGIVGRVESVGVTFCRVSVITENAVAVGAISARSGVRGIVKGALGLRENGHCIMDYMDEFADIQIDDVILSSGTGGLYPYGFPIGRVIELRHNGNERTLTAVLEPCVDLENLSRVMIVKGEKLMEIEGEEAS